jgi:ClpP class serine protease
MKRSTNTGNPTPIGMGATPWAVLERFPLAAALDQFHKAAAQHTTAPRGDYYTDLLKGTGGFTSYINPDGTQVSCLDKDYRQNIQPGAVALVPLHGLMYKSAPDWAQIYDVVNTGRVQRDVEMAAADERVSAIVVHASTPGGMVYGVEGLSNAIKRAAATKPVHTYVDDLIASAGVFATAHSTSIVLGGGATEVGSIGTMTSLVNDDEMWAKYGIEWIDVYATASTEKNKAFEEARQGKPEKLIAEQLDPLNNIFLATVRAGRGAKLQETEEGPLNGRMYVGMSAVQVGLADSIATLNETIALARAGATPTTTMSKMSKLAAFVASVTQYFVDKSAPTADEISEANQALATEGIAGVQLVVSEQATATAELQQQLDAATQARTTAEAEVARLTGELNAVTAARDEAQAQLDTAQEQATTANTTLEATLQAHNVPVPEGQTALEVAVATLKQWAEKPGSKHAGSSRQGDDKETADTELYPSLAAAKQAGIKV